MGAKKRKTIKRIIYYILAVILFLIVTPTVILWAFGFRINLQNHKISQTGILLVKTNEAGFDIFINDKKAFINKTTGTVKGLLPNDYLVTIKKDGFIPWSKTITIEPQKITHKDYIVLFPNNLKPEKDFADITEYILTPDKSAIIGVNNEKNKVEKIDITNKKVVGEAKVPNIESFDPSNNGSKILVKQGSPENKFIIVDFDKNGAINEVSSDLDNLNQIAWLPNNNQILFLIYNESLYNANVSDNPMAFNLLKANVLNFKFANNQIFYLQKNDIGNNQQKTLSLWQANLAFNNPQELIKEIPSTSYQIIPSPDGQKIILKENSKGIIYRVQNQKLEEFNEGIKDVVWDSAGQKFLSYSDYEIWLTEIKGNTANTSLVNRYSETIDNLTWYPDDYHLIFTLGGNKLEVAEEEKGDNLTEISSFTAQNQNVSLITSRQTITIFFLNKKGTDSVPGLYNLNLKNP